jgi:hypothetical protein
MVTVNNSADLYDIIQ